MTFRDKELQERPLFMRAFSFTAPGNSLVFSSVLDSRIAFHQPPGIGVSGGILSVWVEVAGTSSGAILKLDYADEPNGPDPSYALTIAGNGIYQLDLPLIAARDASEQIISLFRFGGAAGSIYRTNESLLPTLAWRVQ
jgi:hypothetical protein